MKWLQKELQKEAVIGTGKKKESFVEFLWELVSCWLLAVGTSLLQNVQLPYPLATFDILWQTLLTVVLLALFSRRWFLMVIVTVQISLLGLLLMLLLQMPIVESITDAIDFCGWFFQGMPYDEAWSTGSGMTVLHVLLNIGIGILMFFVVRVSRGAWPPLILCFSLLILIMTFGDPTNNAAATAAYLAGCVPMIARDRYSGRRLFSGEEKFRVMGARWGVSTAAGVLCLVSAVVLLLLIPVDTDSLRVRWCSELAADFQSVTHWFTAEQKKADTLTLEDLGLQPYPDRLGGNLEPAESQVLATTDADTSMLMRMTTYSTFTGYNWENDFETAYRYDGPFTGTQREQLGNTAMEGPMSSALSNLAPTDKVTVTLQADTVLLPSMGQVTAFTENTETKNPLLFNGNGELLSFFGYDAGYSYTVEGLQYPFGGGLTSDEMDRFEIATMTGEDDYFDDEDNLAMYLELPEDFSEEAKTIARTVTSGQSCRLDQAVALSRYFSRANGYGYNDHPGPLRAGENIVDKLLETRRGYSVYYATAMATMARSAGIPSRLVAGYRTAPDESGTYVVDASRPYTWVECYIRTLGWVAFDPTPRQSTTNVPEMEIKPVEKDIPEEDPEDPQAEADPLTRPNSIKVITLILLILLLLALILLILRTVFIQRLYALPTVNKLFRSSSAKAELYYRDILRQLRYLSRPLRRGETVLEWLEDPALSAALEPETLEALRQAFVPMMAMHYGDQPAAPEAVEPLAQVHGALEPSVKAALRVDVYWLNRRVRRPWLNPTVILLEYKERKRDR